MAKHSKHANTRPNYTSAERAASLGELYGTQKKVLTADNQRPWDVCCLSLTVLGVRMRGNRREGGGSNGRFSSGDVLCHRGIPFVRRMDICIITRHCWKICWNRRKSISVL